MATCYPNQLSTQLKNTPPAVLLLWGEDAGALRQSAEAAVAASGLDPYDPFGSDKLTLEDIANDPTRLPTLAATVPFGAARRLITLGGLTGQEGADALDMLTQAVKATLEGPLENCFIVLAVPYALEKKSPLVKVVEAHAQGLAVRFFVDRAQDVSAYLRGAFDKAGQRVESDALQLLAQQLGADRDIAAREVEKLCLYAGGEAITAEHVRACVAGAIPNDVFRLAEAVAGRDRALADKLTQNLLAQGEDLNGAFMVVVGHLQKIQHAQNLLAQGVSMEEVLAKNGKARAPSEAKNAFTRQVRQYPTARLATLPAYALDTLLATRSGTFKGRHAQLPLARALLALAC